MHCGREMLACTPQIILPKLSQNNVGRHCSKIIMQLLRRNLKVYRSEYKVMEKPRLEGTSVDHLVRSYAQSIAVTVLRAAQALLMLAFRKSPNQQLFCPCCH